MLNISTIFTTVGLGPPDRLSRVAVSDVPELETIVTSSGASKSPGAAPAAPHHLPEMFEFRVAGLAV